MDTIKAVNGRLAASMEASAEDVLVEAASLLRDAAELYIERDRVTDAGLLKRLARALEPGEPNPLSEDFSDKGASPVPVRLALSQEDLLKHFTRAIFALKTPSPDGSSHYQSGWDDGLEAAMDAVREAVPVVFKSWDGEL